MAATSCRASGAEELPVLAGELVRASQSGAPRAALTRSCCSRVELFLVVYTLIVVGIVMAIEGGSHHGTALLAMAPPTTIVVFLSRTFGSSVDHRQIVFTFFSAVLLMQSLLLLIYQVLAPSGLLRFLYSLAPSCGDCFEEIGDQIPLAMDADPVHGLVNCTCTW